MSFDQVASLILAAGKGSRMKSDIPKVLHEVLGKTMLGRVIDSIKEAGVDRINIVLGTNLNPFKTLMQQYPDLGIAQQTEQSGTAHAVASAASLFEGAPESSFAKPLIAKGQPTNHPFVLITTGDTPCLKPDELRQFIHTSIHEDADISVLGMEVPNSFGYGRLILSSDGKKLSGIVEEKDANEQQKQIQLCNSGIIFAKTKSLFECLKLVSNDNQQKEYYLTDCVKIANTLGMNVSHFSSQNWQQFAGVNTPEQLVQVTKYLNS